MKVYRRKTHIDQYLNFSSHHPLDQKLGVVKSLLDGCNNIVSEQEDREKEVEHITNVLEICGAQVGSLRRRKNSKVRREIPNER